MIVSSSYKRTILIAGVAGFAALYNPLLNQGAYAQEAPAVAAPEAELVIGSISDQPADGAVLQSPDDMAQAPDAQAVMPAEGLGEGLGEGDESNGRFDELDPQDLLDMDAALQRMSLIRPDTAKPEEIGTLVFTLWQHSLLQQAKQTFTTREVTQEEIERAKNGELDEVQKPKGIRELSLSGILFKTKDDWVVWLNGQRWAPNALPKQVIDIKVSKTHIDLKWFDEYTNLIYPVRMRPHQRFNLDSRIFLPGLTADAAAQLQAVSR